MPVRPLDDETVVQLIQCVLNPEAPRVQNSLDLGASSDIGDAAFYPVPKFNGERIASTVEIRRAGSQ